MTVMHRISDIGKNAKGSVLLEYVLLLSIGVTFVVFSLWLFEPGVGFTENAGKPFVAYFKRVLVGISLPIP